MFNMKKVSVMVASALYISAGTSHAALNQAQEWAEQPADYAPKPMVSAETNWDGKINQTVKKQSRIFTPEKDITGVQTYIVQLIDAPISAYDGSLKGLASTRETVATARQTTAKPLDLNKPEIASYSNHLASKRQNVVNSALTLQGLQLKVDREFSVTLNGFTTRMTQEEAARLAKVPGIKHIARSKIYPLTTFNTIEQTGAKALWSNSQSGLTSNKGEGVVVGIIDTGINTDHPSFAAVGDDGYTHTNPLGDTYLGDCAKAEFADRCNDKLIGVYSYPEITVAYSDPVFEESRPAYGEDYNSHGSHVAGTAAGNVLYDITYKEPGYGSQNSGTETNLIFPQVSGMAPHANIISYQVCWPGDAGDPYAGCPGSAIIAAIEQSAIDNVDVLNASLGGFEEDPWVEPVEQAFFNAANSGVFVAVAAGNSGPYLQSADHSSPWVTTVAAHTPSSQVVFSDKTLENLSGGDTDAPTDMIAAGITFDELTGLIVSASDYPNPNEPVSRYQTDCDQPYPAGTFDFNDDPNTPDIDESQEDVIVVCKRSSKPLYAKANNVLAGGAEGVIIYNLSPYQDRSPAPQLPYPAPTAHVTNAEGVTLLNWLSTGSGHKGTITANTANTEEVDEERIAYFSSRGPSYFGFDTLLVDIAAPGVDVFAASSDDQPFSKNPSSTDWQTMSGTSMASPHVAGAAALLKQSHPEWSPMEIQSALMLTANNNLKNAQYLNNYKDEGFDSSLQDMGAGRMHVDLADKAGLVMHESIENMKTANPNLGGRLKALNTAYMVDNNCGLECSFMRTVTATEDATWSVSAEEWIGNSTITVSPREFSLKAGETQNIVVEVKMNQVAQAIDNVEVSGNQGQIKLVSSNPNSPVLEMPVWTFNGDTGLPSFIKVDAHRRSSTINVGPFNTDEVSDFTSRSFGLVEGQQNTVKLFTDTTSGDPFDLVDVDGEMVNPNHVEWTTVPQDAKMLSASPVGEASRVLMFMGKDSNNDGLPSMDETICMSTSFNVTNFCNIVDPEAGEYFTVYMSLANIPWGEEDQGRDITFATAVVQEGQSNLTVSAPEKIAGYKDYELTLSYNLPDMEVGDIYFGGFDLGSNPEDAGNLGFVPVIINQIDKDMRFTANKEQATVGELVDFKIEVIANNEQAARNFTIDTAFPEGIEIIEDSIVATASTPATPELVDNVLSLQGTQETTKDVARNYKITTNLTDEMCTLGAAKSPYPNYLDLRELGWRTLEGVQGQYWNEFEYSFKELMATDLDVSFPFFNKYHFDSIKLNPAGLVTFGSNGRTTPFHVELPSGGGFPPPPPYLIAPFWVGDNTIPERVDGTYGNYEANAGITPTYTQARDWLVLEWDNIQRSQVEGQSVDVELFMRMNIAYEPGEYEMMFAYDNVNLADNQGSIGFKAADGRIIVNGDMPVDLNIGDGFAYDNLDEVVHDELVVCMDYVGPEVSKFDVQFQAYIGEAAAAQMHTLTVNNGLEGADDEVLTLELNVLGNISLSDFPDMQVEENNAISFDVLYADENNVSNQIDVLGNNFSYEVSGNTSGSTVTVTPNENFHGDIDVTVKVSDKVNPADAATSSFLLSVISDGIELGCTDSEAINFDENANKDDGSCVYSLAELSIVELPDMTVMENGKLGNIAVELSREVDAEFTLAVAADNADVTIDGTMFSITPNANFYGVIPVTVTMTSGETVLATDFELSVISDGIELGCTDTAATNFNPEANTDDGSCEYPEEIEEDDDSGSFGWLLLAFAPLLTLRRKKSQIN